MNLNCNLLENCTPNHLILDDRPLDVCSLLLPELLTLVCGNLDAPSLCNLSRVSREWYVLSSKDEAWKHQEKVYKVWTPNLKCKIRRSLFPVFQAIKASIEERNQDFYCSLAYALFSGNIHSIKHVPCEDDLDTQFEILLAENREFTFFGSELKNMCIPKKVNLIVSKMGFSFTDPIKVNNNLYKEIWGGTISVTFTHSTSYIDPSSPIISTTTKFLDCFLYKDGKSKDKVSFGWYQSY